MSKHTPTPWEAEERADTIKIGAVKGIYITKLGMGESGEYRDEQTANAELIVKAVNSHDALVEALKSIKLDCEVCSYNSTDDMTETDLYNYAVEALKLAEGSEA